MRSKILEPIVSIWVFALLTPISAQQHIYQDPTYAQVDALIAAAAGKTPPNPTNQQLYMSPTYEQVDRLISTVKAGREEVQNVLVTTTNEYALVNSAVAAATNRVALLEAATNNLEASVTSLQSLKADRSTTYTKDETDSFLDVKVSKGGDTMTGGLSVPEIEITDGGTIYGARRISADRYTGSEGNPAVFPDGIAGPPEYEWDNYSYVRFPFGLRAGRSMVGDDGFCSIDDTYGYDSPVSAKFPYGLRTDEFVGSRSGFFGIEGDGDEAVDSYAKFPNGLRANNYVGSSYGFIGLEYNEHGGMAQETYAKFPYGLRADNYVGSSSGFIGIEYNIDSGMPQEVYAKFPYGLRADNYVGSSSGFIGLEYNVDSGMTQEVYASFPNGLYSPSTAYVEAYAGGSPSSPSPAYFPNGIIGRDGLVEFFSLDGTTYSNLRPDGTQVATLGLLDSEGYIKSESDPVFTAWLDGSFSNAVLAVGLNVDTNAVAVLNEIADGFGGFPLGAGGTATTIGGLLAALAAAIAWLKKNKVGSFESVGGATATVENGVAKLGGFFTESNSLLNGRLSYSRNATGLKDRAFNALTFDGTEYNLSTALAAVTPTASGQPRDLLIVATATAATTISFTAGTIKGDKPTIDGSGTWLITLTEYASGVWYCRQIKMEDAA